MIIYITLRSELILDNDSLILSISYLIVTLIAASSTLVLAIDDSIYTILLSIILSSTFY
jgi:hypothetical protein